MDDQVPIIEKDQLEGDPDVTDGKEIFVPQQDSVESADLPELRVYTRRWYILGIFCAMSCLQCVVWNTWGPIEDGALYAFGWSDSTVPMFANWGTIMFVLTVVPLSKMVEIDLRKTVLLVSGLMAVGTVLRLCRLITKNPAVFLTSCHICAILNGISGVTVMAAPPLLSSTWFPTSERTTATAINQAANSLGNGIAMLVGPALVHYKNVTGNNPTQYFTALYLTDGSNSGQTPDQVKANIDIYMEILAGLAVLLFVLFLIYFPSKPLHPPAPSSAIERTEFVKGIKALFTNKNVLLACFAYSVPMDEGASL